jgi:hypothetical protein
MDFETQFLIFVLFVFVFFGFFIKLLLRNRKKSLLENTRLTSSDAWNSIKLHATAFGLERSNLIYAIYQDENHWDASIFVRNNLDQNIAKTVHPLINRKKIMTINDEEYVITHLMTWKEEVTFHKEGSVEILARWSEDGWFGKHKIEIPNIGTLFSSGFSLDFKARYKYSLNGKIVGLKEDSINGYPIGRVAILPNSIPDTVRAFILSK